MYRLSVSIIIDNYNYADFLEQAIRSALAQDYFPRQIIVVDDGSTDGSRQLLGRYANDPRITCVLKENGGQASAFNAGFAASTGDLVCLLDSDDLWHPTKLSQVVRAAHRSPDASIICHPVQSVSADGGAHGSPKPRRIPFGSIKQKVISSGGYWRWPPTSGLCFRRSFLEQVLPMPEAEFRTCADAYLATLAPLFGDVASFQAPAASYRIHGTNHWADTGAPHDARVRKESQRLEMLTGLVNRKLTELRRPERLSLSDHLPYRMLQRMCGGTEPLWSVALCALQWPGDHAHVRLSMFTKNFWSLLRAPSTQTACFTEGGVVWT